MMKEYNGDQQESQTESLLNNSNDAPPVVTAWMQCCQLAVLTEYLSKCFEILVKSILFPFAFVGLWSTLIIGLLLCGTSIIGRPETLNEGYFKLSAVGVIVSSIIALIVFNTSCPLGTQVTNDSPFSLDFSEIDPGSARWTPSVMNPGDTSQLKVSKDSYLSATTNLPVDPWYFTMTVDKNGMRAKVEGGLGLKSTTPHINWGVCEYTIVSPSTKKASCDTFIFMNSNNDQISYQNIQPQGCTATDWQGNPITALYAEGDFPLNTGSTFCSWDADAYDQAGNYKYHESITCQADTNICTATQGAVVTQDKSNVCQYSIGVVSSMLRGSIFSLVEDVGVSDSQPQAKL